MPAFACNNRIDSFDQELDNGFSRTKWEKCFFIFCFVFLLIDWHGIVVVILYSGLLDYFLSTETTKMISKWMCMQTSARKKTSSNDNDDRRSHSEAASTAAVTATQISENGSVCLLFFFIRFSVVITTPKHSFSISNHILAQSIQIQAAIRRFCLSHTNTQRRRHIYFCIICRCCCCCCCFCYE